MSLAEKIALLSDPTPIFYDPEDDVNHETTAKVVDFQTSDDDSDEFGRKSLLRLRNETLLADQDERYAGKKISRKYLQKSLLKDDDDNEEEEDDDDDVAEQVEGSYTSSDENNIEAEKDYDGSDSFSKDKIYDEYALRSEEDDSSGDDEILHEFKKQLTKSASSNIVDDTFESTDEKSEADSKVSDEDNSMDENEDGDDNMNDNDDESENEIDSETNDRKEENFLFNESIAENTVQTFSQMHIDEEVNKGLAVKAQLRLWDALLECRIKLQKVLLAANQLPQFDVWAEFCEKGGNDFETAAQTCQKTVKHLLDAFIELQTMMLANNPETKYVLQPGSMKSKLESDEEIPNDTEDENDLSNYDAVNVKDTVGTKRKLKVNDYPEFLKKRHKEFEGFRNATIQKWNDKTKLASGKLKKSFESFEQSTLMQIEQILCDKDRLIRRTQLKRSNYELLGKNLSLEITDGEGHTVSGQEAVLKQDFHLKDHDPEIFDDNDFYHNLLRELIEHKTMDLQDPIALGRQWLEIQKLRSKMKRKVDTRASKGRKVRYDVHPKLVNFMAPIEDCTMTEESRNDLFNSLFGKKTQNFLQNS